MVKLTAVRLKEQAVVVVVERTHSTTYLHSKTSGKTLPMTADLTGSHKIYTVPPAML
ncbi:hypothetical protein E2C01_046909 [Portunus trituberculatus]|uniref:Uncharacterized protein n=1 Tax=Portunus trituberculatus TaxID=210409 RepID=A0A5B7G6A2_PORTR|nr:hypothetical protein [Portunus trituberculatus]